MTSLINLLITSQLRGLVLLLVAWALALLLRRRSPAFECIVWRGAFAGLLAIPLLTSVAPPVTLPHEASLASTGFLTSLQTTTEHYRLHCLDTPTAAEPQNAPTAAEPQNPSTAAEPQNSPTAAKPQNPSTAAPAQNSATPLKLPSSNIVLSIWITGAAIMLLRLATAFLLRANLLRRSTPLENNSAKDTIAQLRRDLRIRPPVTLRLHPDLPSPLSWGIFRPTILLPADAAHWDRSTLRLVLSHELSHFSHRDAVYRLLSELALVAYWINPLAWIALRHARLSEEQATDAAVLRRGEDPAHYADLLLNFARRSGRHATPIPALSSPMAQPSTIAARLEAVLKPGNRFSHPPRRTRILCAAAIIIVAVAAGGLAFQARSASEEAKPDDGHLLYTKVYTLSPATIRRVGTNAADLIWKARGIEPPPGASVVVNSTTRQLIIRTTADDFAILEEGLFKKWRQEETLHYTYADIEVLLYELPAPDADRLEREFSHATDASGALLEIRQLAGASPGSVHLAGMLSMPTKLESSRRSRIGVSTGNKGWDRLIDLETTVNLTRHEGHLRVALAAQLHASSPVLSITTILEGGIPRLAGFIDSPDTATRTAVFLNLRQN